MRGPVISRRDALGGVLAAGAALSAAGPALAQASRLTVTAAGGRPVEVTVWPAAGVQRGLVQFSHGALSSPAKYDALIGPWVQAGFKVIAPLHTDSTDHPDHGRLKMADSWRYRLEDMAALATLTAGGPYLAVGHSYGALVALTLGGAEGVRPEGFAGPLRASLAQAVVAFSPPAPVPVLMTAQGYGRLAVPAFIETGTADNPPAAMGGGDWHGHLAAFDAAAPGEVYALVLKDVDHYFGGLICRPELPGPHQTAGMAVASPLSTDFIAAYAAGDTVGRTRLAAACGVHPGFALTRKTQVGQAAAVPSA